MADPLAPDVRTFVEQRRVARLATADAQDRPHAVPIVYVLEGSCLYFALDAKPKSVPPERLRRVRNIIENPRVAVIVDDTARTGVASPTSSSRATPPCSRTATRESAPWLCCGPSTASTEAPASPQTPPSSASPSTGSSLGAPLDARTP